MTTANVCRRLAMLLRRNAARLHRVDPVPGIAAVHSVTMSVADQTAQNVLEGLSAALVELATDLDAGRI